jgi:hypothetical protein
MCAAYGEAEGVLAAVATRHSAMRMGTLARAGLAALAAIGLLHVTGLNSARGAENVCARFGAATVSGHVKSSKLTEISGVVASRQYPGVYWTHNDSGGKPEVFALTLDGTDLGSYAFPGATATDWEGIAIGPKSGATGSFIYAADIGDNAAEAPLNGLGTAREKVTIFRAVEPAVAPKAPGVPLTGVERFDLIYPAGREDAEAVFVDPISGDLVIVTKSPIGQSRILVAPAAAMVNGASITMLDFGTIQIIPPVKVSTFPGTWVTGADISADGSLILVRTYQAVLAFARAKGKSVPDALKGPSCDAPQVDEGQGESIAIATDGSRYTTISEGLNQPINTFSIAGAAAVTTTTTAPTSVRGQILARTGGGTARALPLAAAVVAVAVAARVAIRPLRPRQCAPGRTRTCGLTGRNRLL